MKELNLGGFISRLIRAIMDKKMETTIIMEKKMETRILMENYYN